MIKEKVVFATRHGVSFDTLLEARNHEAAHRIARKVTGKDAAKPAIGYQFGNALVTIERALRLGLVEAKKQKRKPKPAPNPAKEQS